MDRCHMRRQDRRITDEAQIESILARGRYVAIALVDGDEPYVVTLSYGYAASERRLYFHVAHEGYKMDLIARNPRACATVVVESGYTQGECEHPFESVVIRGTLRPLTSDAEKRRAIEVLVESLEEDPQSYWDSRSWSLEDRLGSFTGLVLEIESRDAKQGK